MYPDFSRISSPLTITTLEPEPPTPRLKLRVGGGGVFVVLLYENDRVWLLPSMTVSYPYPY